MSAHPRPLFETNNVSGEPEIPDLPIQTWEFLDPVFRRDEREGVGMVEDAGLGETLQSLRHR